MGPMGDDRDQGVCVTYERAKRCGVGRKRTDVSLNVSGDTVKGGCQAFDGLNRRTGLRNRRYKWDSEYHVAPKCPWREVPRSEFGLVIPEHGKAHEQPYSATSTGSPVFVTKMEQSKCEGAISEPEQSFSATLDSGGLFLVADSDSVAVLDTRVAANMVCFRLLDNHNRIL